MTNWIPCADMLPDFGEVVFLYEEARGMWVGSRDEAEDNSWLWGNAYGSMWWDGTKWKADVEQDDDYKPTHWQRLPMPPAVKENA